MGGGGADSAASASGSTRLKREKVTVSRSSRVRLCDPVNCSPPGSSVHGILQARTLDGLPFLLQGIFPTQGSNPSLLHRR